MLAWSDDQIKLVNSKGNEPWIFTGRTVAEGEAPTVWPPDVKSWLTGKDLMLRKTLGKRRRGRERMKWLDSITDSTAMSVSKLQETVKSRGTWATVHGSQRTPWLSNWTKNKWSSLSSLLHHSFSPFLQGKWKSLSCVQLFATPWTIQSMEFSKPEYWSG